MPSTPSYPVMPAYPAGPQVGPTRRVSDRATGIKVTLAGQGFTALVQISNATAPATVAEHLFQPAEGDWDTVATVYAGDPPQDIQGPVKYARVVLTSGILTGGNIAESTTHGNTYQGVGQANGDVQQMARAAAAEEVQALSTQINASVQQQVQVQTASVQAQTDGVRQAIGNLKLADLTGRSRADGPQFADGCRWTWQANGTPNGGTVVQAADGGVWVREFAGDVLTEWWTWPASGDVSAQMQICINEAVRLGRGLQIHAGVFEFGQVDPKNCRIRGAGDGRTILLHRYGAQHLFYGESGGPSAYRDGFQLSHVTLRGQSELFGFEEHKNLLSLNGYRNFLIENIGIEQPQSDGIYLGCGWLAGVEAGHNESGVIRNIRADGGSRRANRNVISVIDGWNIVIDGVRARNFTHKGQPGIVDIEPNADTFHRIGNIKVRDIQAVDCPDAYVVSVSLAHCKPGLPFGRVDVEHVHGKNVRAPIHGNWHWDAPGAPAAADAVPWTFRHISASLCEVPFMFEGTNALTIEDAQFTDSKFSAMLGYKIGATVRNTTLRRVRLQRVAVDEAVTPENYSGLAVRQVDGLLLEDVEFINCGPQSGDVRGIGLWFVGANVCRGLTLRRVRFAGERHTLDIAVAADYTVVSAECRETESNPRQRFRFTVRGTPVTEPPPAAGYADGDYFPNAAPQVGSAGFAVLGWTRAAGQWVEQRVYPQPPPA